MDPALQASAASPFGSAPPISYSVAAQAALEKARKLMKRLTTTSLSLKRLKDEQSQGHVAHSLRVKAPVLQSHWPDLQEQLTGSIEKVMAKARAEMHSLLITCKEEELNRIQTDLKSIVPDLETQLDSILRDVVADAQPLDSWVGVSAHYQHWKPIILQQTEAQTRVLFAAEFDRLAVARQESFEAAKARLAAAAQAQALPAEATVGQLVDNRLQERLAPAVHKLLKQQVNRQQQPTGNTPAAPQSKGKQNQQGRRAGKQGKKGEQARQQPPPQQRQPRRQQNHTTQQQSAQQQQQQHLPHEAGLLPTPHQPINTPNNQFRKRGTPRTKNA